MLEDVKERLRITSDSFDVEVEELIEACKEDLVQSGVASSSIDEDDYLIKRAIITYCKAYFGADNPDYDRLVQAYNLIKTHLAMSSDYNTEAS